MFYFLLLILSSLIFASSALADGRDIFIRNLKNDINAKSKGVYELCQRRIGIEVNVLTANNTSFIKKLLDACLSGNTVRSFKNQSELISATRQIVINSHKCVFSHCTSIIETSMEYIFPRLNEADKADVFEQLSTALNQYSWSTSEPSDLAIVLKNTDHLIRVFINYGYYDWAQSIFKSIKSKVKDDLVEFQELTVTVSDIDFALDRPDLVEAKIKTESLLNLEVIVPLKITFLSAQISQLKISEAEKTLALIKPQVQKQPIPGYQAWLFLEEADLYLRKKEYEKAKEALQQSEKIYKEHLPIYLLFVNLKRSVLQRETGKFSEAVKTLNVAAKYLKHFERMPAFTVDYHIERAIQLFIQKKIYDLEKVKGNINLIAPDKKLNRVVNDRLLLLESGLKFTLNPTLSLREELMRRVKDNSEISHSKKKDIISVLLVNSEIKKMIENEI